MTRARIRQDGFWGVSMFRILAHPSVQPAVCACRLTQPGNCGRGRLLPSSCRPSTTSQWRESRGAVCVAEMGALGLSPPQPCPLAARSRPNECWAELAAGVTERCLRPARRSLGVCAVACLVGGPLSKVDPHAGPAAYTVMSRMPPIVEGGTGSVYAQQYKFVDTVVSRLSGASGQVTDLPQ